MYVVTWLWGLLRRRPMRVAGTVAGIAIAVALLGSLGAFFAASKAHMTDRAVSGVTVDWQVQITPGTSPATAGRAIAAAPGVVKSLPVGYAATTGLTATAGGTVQTTGPGKVLGLPPGYPATFPGEIRFLTGARSGVLLAQQTAANLHAGPGTIIKIGRRGLPSLPVRVAGVVDLPAADSMFQAIGTPPGTAPQAPPDNVVLLPASQWQAAFGSLQHTQPAAVYTEYHVGLSPDLPPDPAAAFADVMARAKNLEARLAGGGLVGDNLGAQLDAARGDAIYAELLFLFLGLPGAILAALITGVIGAAGGERRRREQALLRLRGASPGTILWLAGAEALLAGVLGSAIGLVGAVIASRLAFGATRFGSTAGQAVAWAALAALAGLILAALTIGVPAWRDARTLSVRGARAVVGPARRPLWARLYLDAVLLAVAVLLFWRTARSGYQILLVPEGVTSISVSYETFLAPLALWAGAALLTWRISTAVLSRGRPALARASRPLAGGLSEVVAASMSRQRRLLSRGLMIIGLTASFAVSTAIFNTTYSKQSLVDAQLTNGADVTASTTAAAGLPPRVFAATRRLNGVAAVQPMMHRFAYVGSDLQDLYGINPTTISTATPISDAFFPGRSASATLAALAARPDAVLVSEETVLTYQLRMGDLLRLRVQSARDHAYHLVPFHFAGVVREFPTAPKDSFFIANSSYIARVTGSPAYQDMLVRTSGPPPAVAREVRQVLGPASGATVQDLSSQLKITLSGLTALDLSGLTRLELAFAFILAVAASGLVLALGLVERRRTFAIAAALGARSRQLASFVWSEAIYVTVGGVVLGALSGWALSFIITKILTGVFDPPPPHLFIPWVYLAALGAVTCGAIAATGTTIIRALRRPSAGIIRDL